MKSSPKMFIVSNKSTIQTNKKENYNRYMIKKLDEISWIEKRKKMEGKLQNKQLTSYTVGLLIIHRLLTNI